MSRRDEYIGQLARTPLQRSVINKSPRQLVEAVLRDARLHDHLAVAEIPEGYIMSRYVYPDHPETHWMLLAVFNALAYDMKCDWHLSEEGWLRFVRPRTTTGMYSRFDLPLP